MIESFTHVKFLSLQESLRTKKYVRHQNGIASLQLFESLQPPESEEVHRYSGFALQVRQPFDKTTYDVPFTGLECEFEPVAVSVSSSTIASRASGRFCGGGRSPYRCSNLE